MSMAKNIFGTLAFIVAMSGCFDDAATNSVPPATDTNVAPAAKATHTNIFYVETPGGVQKIFAKDTLDAIGRSGLTVWPEKDWIQSPHDDIQVLDRTKPPDYPLILHTNSDGFIYFVDTKPPPTILLTLTNVPILRIYSHTFPLWNLNADQIALITNSASWSNKILHFNRVEITSDGISCFW